MNKPNGQFYLANNRDAVLDFVRALPIRKMSGIGKVTEKVLNALDIKTCADIVCILQKRTIYACLFVCVNRYKYVCISMCVCTYV